MELTLTALIKAIILHWGRGSSAGDKQLETQQKSSKFKMHQLPSPLPPPLPSFHVTIDCTLVGYSTLTGSQFFCIRKIFILQAERVFLIHSFFYAGFYCILLASPNVDDVSRVFLWAVCDPSPYDNTQQSGRSEFWFWRVPFNPSLVRAVSDWLVRYNGKRPSFSRQRKP